MTTRVFLDTDAACEIDDQHAIAYAVRHPNVHVVGIGAAFFTGAGYVARPDSMEASYAEATRMVELLDRPDVPVHRGLRGPFMQTEADEDASRAIIELAHAGPDPLTVIS